MLIDTPPSLGLLTINAFVAATGVIVPVQCEYLSLRGLVQLENTLAMVRENLNPHVAVEGIVPTMFDGRTLHSREAIEILEENFGDLVYRTRIRKTVRYAEAPVKGSSVLKYDPTGAAADAYRELAREVSLRRRPRMARKRASMREGPLAELFRATEAAQRAQQGQPEPEEAAGEHRPADPEPEPPRRLEPAQPVQPELPIAPEDVTLEATVEHVYDFEAGRPAAPRRRGRRHRSPSRLLSAAARRRRPEPAREPVEAPAPVEEAPLPRGRAACPSSSPTLRPRAASSRRCRRARRACTSRATSPPTSRSSASSGSAAPGSTRSTG